MKLGDNVAEATKAVGIKPCGEPRKRQETLNAISRRGLIGGSIFALALCENGLWKSALTRAEDFPEVVHASEPLPATTKALAIDQDVCGDHWTAHKKDEFTWVNSMTDPVVISQDGTNKWPFTLPSPIDVAGRRSNNKPGRTDCGILDGLQGPFTYNVYTCDRGNPKTVIIG